MVDCVWDAANEVVDEWLEDIEFSGLNMGFKARIVQRRVGWSRRECGAAEAAYGEKMKACGILCV